MARQKRIFREWQHPRDSRGRFARRGSPAWVARAGEALRAAGGDAANLTRGEGGRPRIARAAKATAVLHAHTIGGRPTAVRAPQATVTRREPLPGLAAFNAPDAPAAPAMPRKRTPRPAPGAAALIAARAAEQAPHAPAMAAARTAPDTAPVPGAENYAAMRRHTLIALARDAGIGVRGRSNTDLANALAAHDEQVRAQRSARLNPSGVGGSVDTPRDSSNNGGMTSTTPEPVSGYMGAGEALSRRSEVIGRRISLDVPNGLRGPRRITGRVDVPAEAPTPTPPRKQIPRATRAAALAPPAHNAEQRAAFDKMLGADGNAPLVQNPHARRIVEQMEAHGWVVTAQDSMRRTVSFRAPDGREIHAQFLLGSNGDRRPQFHIGQGVRRQDVTFKAAMAHVITPHLAEEQGPNVSVAMTNIGLPMLHAQGWNDRPLASVDPSYRPLQQASDNLSRGPGGTGTPKKTLAEVIADLRQAAATNRRVADERKAYNDRLLGGHGSVEDQHSITQRQRADEFERVADELERMAQRRAAYEAERDRRAALPPDIRPGRSTPAKAAPRKATPRKAAAPAAPAEAPAPAPRTPTTTRARIPRDTQVQAIEDQRAGMRGIYQRHARLTRAEFDAMPENERNRVLADLRRVAGSGEEESYTIPSNRSNMGMTVRGRRDAAHVDGAREKLRELTYTAPPPVDNSVSGRAARLRAGDVRAIDNATIAELNEIAREAGLSGGNTGWPRNKLVDYIRNQVEAGADRLRAARSGDLADALRGATPSQVLAILDALESDGMGGTTVARLKAAAKALGIKVGSDKRLIRRALADGAGSAVPKAEAAQAAAPARPRFTPEARRAALASRPASTPAARVETMNVGGRPMHYVIDAQGSEVMRTRERHMADGRAESLNRAPAAQAPAAAPSTPATPATPARPSNEAIIERARRAEDRVARLDGDNLDSRESRAAYRELSEARAALTEIESSRAPLGGGADTATPTPTPEPGSREAKLAAKRAELEVAQQLLQRAGEYTPGGSSRRKTFAVRYDANLRRAGEIGRDIERLKREIAALERPEPPKRPVTNDVEGLEPGDLVKMKNGLVYRVVRVNAKSVKVAVPPGMDDLMPKSKIVQTQKAKVEPPKADAAQAAAPARPRPRFTPEARRAANSRLDTSRDSSQNGGGNAPTTTEANMARTAASTGTPQLGVTESSRGRTTTVTLPDGTTAQRTSRTMAYTHAVVATHDMRAEARDRRATADRLEAYSQALEAWIAAGSDLSQLRRFYDGSGSYNDQQAGIRSYGYFLPGFEPVEQRSRSGLRYFSATLSAPSVESVRLYRDGTPAPERYDGESEYHGPEHHRRQLAIARQRVAQLRGEADQLDAGPEREYYVARWSQRPDTAFGAIGSPEVNAPHTTYQVVGVGGVARQEARPAKAVKTAEEKAAEKLKAAADAKARQAASDQEFVDRTRAAVLESIDRGEDPERHLTSKTEKALRFLAKAVGARIPRQSRDEYGRSRPLDQAEARRLIVEAIRQERQGKA